MSQSQVSARTGSACRSMCSAFYTCLGHTPDGSECQVPMRLYTPDGSVLKPFFSAIVPAHEPGCDEGAWKIGPEAEAAVRGVQDGFAHPVRQWVRAVQLACGLDEGHLAQCTVAQWQAWADLRNTLAVAGPGEVQAVAGVPTHGSLANYEPPTDLTLPFPYVGRLRTTLRDLLRTVSRSHGLVRMSSRLFNGPTAPVLREVDGRCQAASYQQSVDALLLPQEDGEGLLVEVVHVSTWADEPSSGDVPVLGDLLGTDRACTCQKGTNQWRWA